MPVPFKLYAKVDALRAPRPAAGPIAALAQRGHYLSVNKSGHHLGREIVFAAQPDVCSDSR
jgi:hypothetical protein